MNPKSSMGAITKAPGVLVRIMRAAQGPIIMNKIIRNIETIVLATLIIITKMNLDIIGIKITQIDANPLSNILSQGIMASKITRVIGSEIKEIPEIKKLLVSQDMKVLGMIREVMSKKATDILGKIHIQVQKIL